MRPLSFITVLGLGLLVSCESSSPPQESTARLRAVATIPPAARLVESVGGDLVEVTLLLPPGASPHLWQPSAAAMRALHDADLAVIVGGDLEPWAGRLLQAAGGERRDVALLDLLEPSQQLPLDHAGHVGGRGSVDPHLWLSPTRAMSAAHGLSEALIDLAPEHAEEFERLWRQAEEEFQSLIETCERRRVRWREANGGDPPRIVTLHGGWGHFADELGLEVRVIQGTPGIAPSPAAMRSLLDDLRVGGADAVVSEPQLNPATARLVAEATGAPLVSLDALGTEAPTYRDHILGLLDALGQALEVPR